MAKELGYSLSKIKDLKCEWFLNKSKLWILNT
jgi:hypothetical protein